MMTTFAALGDSITLGVGDPAPGGGWRGWAALLADGLPGGRLVNLAANGAHVAGSLTAAGAVVLTMRLPDPGMMLGLPPALARPLARRLLVINEAMDQVAEQFGTVHFDAAADLATYDRRMWSADRLHPSERGHRYIAGRFHDQLAAGGHRLGPRPGTEPTSPPPTRLDTAAWMATKGTAWVLRRCTDLVPYLLVMALRECCWPGPGPQNSIAEIAIPHAGVPEAGVPEAGVPEIGHAP